MRYSEILSIKPFRLLWIGNSISQLGDAFYYVVFMFMVKKITGSDQMVGFIGAAETLPFLLVSPLAGVLADRIDRRKIMLFTLVVSGLILLAFGALIWTSGEPPVWSLFATVILLSIVTATFMPARNAAIPSLVPPEKLVAATSLNAMASNMMPILAHALSATILGILYAVSVKWFFLSAVLINAVSFFIAAAYIARLPVIRPDNTSGAPVLEDLTEGLRYIRRRPDLKVTLVLTALLGLFVSPFFVVYIAINEAWFGGKPQTLAYTEMVFFMAMVVMSYYVGRMKITRPGVAYSLGIAGLGVTVWAMGMTPLLGPWLAWNVLAGLALPFAQIPMSAYVQGTTEDEFRGRVNSVLGMVNIGMMPIGYALGGTMVQMIGLVNAFIVMGGGMIAAGALGMLAPAFRNARMPDQASEASQAA